MLHNIVFKDPWVLLLIPIVLIIIVFYRWRQSEASFVFPSSELVSSLQRSWKLQYRPVLYIFRMIAIIMFIMALAGPRSVVEETMYKTEGIDIVLALDTSGSMAAEDFKLNGKRVNRLTIVKDVVDDFIKDRKNDRIGLVAFAGLAYTVCPLTIDYSWLYANLKRIELGIIKDGTAIGSAIMSSLTRLKNSDAKSKIIIVLTDGMNNAGKIDPLEAARAAQRFGVKIYTIGAGTKGHVPVPIKNFFGRTVYQRVLINIDENTLNQVADLTGGKYFRATDTDSLRKIYKEIDILEKTEIEQFGYREYKELFGFILMGALILLCLETILNNSILIKIPA